MDKIFALTLFNDFLSENGYKLNDEERETLNSIFESVDKQDLNGNDIEPLEDGTIRGDCMLNKNEFESFKTKFLNLKNRYMILFKNYITQFESKASETEVLANNILALSAEFNEIGVQKCLKDLNSDNLLLVMDEFYELDKKGHFFTDIASNAIVYAVENIPEAKTKLKELSSLIIDYAKSNNIYTKDYEKRISEAVEKDDYEDLGVAMDRLYTRVALHLNKNSEIAVNNRKMELVEPNGEIDANFAQGSTGDCWLLSIIQAVTNNEQGLEKLNSMITVNKKNNEISSVSVNIQGKTYEIDYEELKNANEYATGDLDIRALEIAVNRYYLENALGDISNSGYSDMGFECLLGENKVKIQQFEEINDEYLNTISLNNQISIIASRNSLIAIDDNGEIVKTTPGHALNPIGIEDNYVVFYDPWNSGKRLRIDKNVLKNSDCIAFIAQLNNSEA